MARLGVVRFVAVQLGGARRGEARHDETQVNPCVTVRVIHSRLMSLNFWKGAARIGAAGQGMDRTDADSSGAVRHDETAALGSLSLGSNRT
jgi:hypothetical protein